MTTPEPTPADRAAAAAFTLASGEFVNEDLLAEHFAAYRAVATKDLIGELRVITKETELWEFIRLRFPNREACILTALGEIK